MKLLALLPPATIGPLSRSREQLLWTSTASFDFAACKLTGGEQRPPGGRPWLSAQQVEEHALELECDQQEEKEEERRGRVVRPEAVHADDPAPEKKELHRLE